MYTRIHTYIPYLSLCVCIYIYIKGSAGSELYSRFLSNTIQTSIASLTKLGSHVLIWTAFTCLCMYIYIYIYDSIYNST